MCVRGTQQAHTDGDMPVLLLKSPASSPQDYGCQQNCTSNRTYYNIGAAGTCGIKIKILLFPFAFYISFPPFLSTAVPFLCPFLIILSVQTLIVLSSLLPLCISPTSVCSLDSLFLHFFLPFMDVFPLFFTYTSFYLFCFHLPSLPTVLVPIIPFISLFSLFPIRLLASSNIHFSFPHLQISEQLAALSSFILDKHLDFIPIFWLDLCVCFDCFGLQFFCHSRITSKTAPIGSLCVFTSVFFRAL